MIHPATRVIINHSTTRARARKGSRRRTARTTKRLFSFCLFLNAPRSAVIPFSQVKVERRSSLEKSDKDSDDVVGVDGVETGWM